MTLMLANIYGEFTVTGCMASRHCLVNLYNLPVGQVRCTHFTDEEMKPRK